MAISEMLRIMCLILVFTGRLIAEDGKDGFAETEGSWIAVFKERDGKVQPLKSMVVSFKGDKFETTVDGKVIEGGENKLDLKNTPKAYAATITTDGSIIGKTYDGIYEVTGDILRTCVNTNDGKKAPTEFVTRPDTGHQLVIWKRIKHTLRESAVAFLKHNVMGKSVTCSITNKIPAETIETTFERRTSFTNLLETKNGFTFDEHYAIKQVVFDLDRDGEKVGEGRKVDRWGVIRYQIT